MHAHRLGMFKATVRKFSENFRILYNTLNDIYYVNLYSVHIPTDYRLASECTLKDLIDRDPDGDVSHNSFGISNLWQQYLISFFGVQIQRVGYCLYGSETGT